ncbi:hypothetical protein [uncultured Psychrobacter sp.]|uniref:hypothetical protein n=1 Tax=uncultured Psychrobacter sp. TaxID=259303 RepID=UPI0025930409|nr:hypothetical protein [uncultured Psychrobacter sp.]
MSYPLLLLIISLIVIVPTVFVVRGRSNQNLLANKQPTQKYLGNARSATQNHGTKASAEQLQIANAINQYRNHPALPISFRQLLGKIHSQYLALASVKLDPEQRFTVDKLAGARLGEIIEDYLALDTDYAENNIIDSQNNLTSQDITYGQLTSMLEFMQRIQSDGQQQVATNILANRSYLQSVYGEFHPDVTTNDSLQSLKAPDMDLSELQGVPTSELLIERGHSYLKDCDIIAPSELSLANHAAYFEQGILLQLGQLTFTAENIIAYSEALLGNSIDLSAFDKILTKALPQLLRSALNETNSATLDDTGSVNKISSHHQALLEQKIDRVQQLIDDCLNRLEKVAEQQYQTGFASPETLQSVNSTLKSKLSQAQYLLDSGFFSL